MAEGRGRVAVITGASSGIGKEIAKQLAGQGWRVIAHGRDPARVATAESEVRAATSGATVDFVRGDLCVLSETNRMADEIAKLTDRVDLLINNAGGMRNRMAITSEGNEITFAGNHLGHFLLTQRLLPLLRRAAGTTQSGSVRIINVSSRAHERALPIDWDDLQSTKAWTSHDAYAAVKLCTILFTRELAKRLAAEGIVSHSVHPGVVDTNFASHGTQALRDYWEHAPKVGASDAACHIVRVATATELGGTNGRYFHEGQEVAPSQLALDDYAAERLWQESDKLVAQART
jgi:NAD(P)-dependent dehydrogenase (short-subunit alcohol dehydrogenase family)